MSFVAEVAAAAEGAGLSATTLIAIGGVLGYTMGLVAAGTLGYMLGVRRTTARNERLEQIRSFVEDRPAPAPTRAGRRTALPHDRTMKMTRVRFKR